MGEIANQILEGIMCEQCGVYLNVNYANPPSHPCCCAEDAEIAEMYKGRIKQER